MFNRYVSVKSWLFLIAKDQIITWCTWWQEEKLKQACPSSTKDQVKRKLDDSEPGHVVFQGDVITHDPGYLNGHGTYMEQDLLFAGVAGVVEMVNTVISVTPVKTRYNGEFVDVVVGRIVEVQQKQGNINSRLRTRHGAKKNCQCCPVWLRVS